MPTAFSTLETARRPLSIVFGIAFSAALFCIASRARAETDEERALALFEQSAELYEQGRLEESGELLRKAYTLDPNPLLLYNLARVNEGLGNLKQAVLEYRRFLEAAPDTPDRAAIEKRIQSLNSQILERAKLIEAGRKSRERERVLAQRARRDAEQRKPSVIPWVIAAAGGAGLATGAVLGWLSENAESDAESDPTFSGALESRERAETLTRAANISFIAGGILATTGVTWGVLQWPARTASPDRAAIEIEVRPLGVTIQGVF